MSFDSFRPAKLELEQVIRIMRFIKRATVYRCHLPQSQDRSLTLVPCPSDATGLDCEFCGKRYRNFKALQKHKQQHAGRTVCPLCPVLLSSVPALRRHVALKHGKTPEEVYHFVPVKRRRTGAYRYE